MSHTEACTHKHTHTHTHTRTHTHTEWQIHLNAYHTHTMTYKHAYRYIFCTAHRHRYTHTHTHTHTHMHTCTDTNTHTHTYIHTYTHTHTHTHTHMHTCTQTQIHTHTPTQNTTDRRQTLHQCLTDVNLIHQLNPTKCGMCRIAMNRHGRVDAQTVNTQHEVGAHLFVHDLGHVDHKLVERHAQQDVDSVGLRTVVINGLDVECPYKEKAWFIFHGKQVRCIKHNIYWNTACKLHQRLFEKRFR